MPSKFLLSPSALPAAELAWMAGIVDGEGCIYIVKWSVANRKTPVYIMGVSISVTKGDLSMFVANFGGSKRPILLNHPVHKDQFKWEVKNLKAERFLLAIQPYLKWKHEQAVIALELQRSLSNRSHGAPVEVPVGVLTLRELLYQKMAVLNKRGK